MEASGWSVLVEDALIEETESHWEPEKVDDSGLMCCQSLVSGGTRSSEQTSVHPP